MFMATPLQEIFSKDCPEFASLKALRMQVLKTQSRISAIPAHVEAVRQEVAEKSAAFYRTQDIESFESWADARARLDRLGKCANEFSGMAQDITLSYCVDDEDREVLQDAANRVHQLLLQKIADVEAAEDGFLKKSGLTKLATNAAVVSLQQLAKSYRTCAEELENWPNKNHSPWTEYRMLFEELK